MTWYFYVVRTMDGTLYAGVSTDIARRYREHCQQGRKAARYLIAHKPKHLEFSQAIGDRSLALKVEYHFKQLSKSVKEKILRSGKLRFHKKTGKISVCR